MSGIWAEAGIIWALIKTALGIPVLPALPPAAQEISMQPVISTSLESVPIYSQPSPLYTMAFLLRLQPAAHCLISAAFQNLRATLHHLCIFHAFKLVSCVLQGQGQTLLPAQHVVWFSSAAAVTVSG